MTDQATASGLTDMSQVTVLVNKKKNTCKFFSLKLGAWNVRTTNDSNISIRPERATAIICKELEKASIDNCALSELPFAHQCIWSHHTKNTGGKRAIL